MEDGKGAPAQLHGPGPDERRRGPRSHLQASTQAPVQVLVTARPGRGPSSSTALQREIRPACKPAPCLAGRGGASRGQAPACCPGWALRCQDSAHPAVCRQGVKRPHPVTQCRSLRLDSLPQRQGSDRGPSGVARAEGPKRGDTRWEADLPPSLQATLSLTTPFYRQGRVRPSWMVGQGAWVHTVVIPVRVTHQSA